ncbi:MAG: DUF4905 domain-containing protein [Melioribacteraceae bacterium]|nr:DUF4905 domain-containing protein [Melioribacteraceae bacterium]
MKLKKKFKFSDSNQVWRIKITDTDKLFVETRDTEKMNAYFHCYDLFSRKRIFTGLQMREKYWLGIEAIKGDIVFFHRFAKPDMPAHRGIFAFDITTQKTLWDNEAYAFLFLKDDLIYVYQERFEGRNFYTLSINSGEVVEELGKKAEDINKLRDEAELSVDYSNYAFPEKHFGSSSDEKVDSLIANELKNIEVASAVEYINSNGLLLFNFHQIGKKKELINKLKVFDLFKGKEIFYEVLNKSANAFAPDSFFIYKNLVILIKEKKEIIIFEIKY